MQASCLDKGGDVHCEQRKLEEVAPVDQYCNGWLPCSWPTHVQMILAGTWRPFSQQACCWLGRGGPEVPGFSSRLLVRRCALSAQQAEELPRPEVVPEGSQALEWDEAEWQQGWQSRVHTGPGMLLLPNIQDPCDCAHEGF